MVENNDFEADILTLTDEDGVDSSFPTMRTETNL